ncbi:hypothetical protein PENTCL1PPCAC_997, partial [Pristionchus entomophagus]
GESPRIALTTFTEPTGARFWFPCFDEPNKKATMQLTLDHSSDLNAYSNTKVVKIERIVTRTLTEFAKTPILLTYLFPMNLNYLPCESITYRNHMLRAFGPGADLALNQSLLALEKLWNEPR